MSTPAAGLAPKLLGHVQRHCRPGLDWRELQPVSRGQLTGGYPLPESWLRATALQWAWQLSLFKVAQAARKEHSPDSREPRLPAGRVWEEGPAGTATAAAWTARGRQVQERRGRAELGRVPEPSRSDLPSPLKRDGEPLDRVGVCVGGVRALGSDSKAGHHHPPPPSPRRGGFAPSKEMRGLGVVVRSPPLPWPCSAPRLP